MVTPHAGVWIETRMTPPKARRCRVTPHAGVWIETIRMDPLRGTGRVTPHAGVWIETTNAATGEKPEQGHSPRGSVD